MTKRFAEDASLTVAFAPPKLVLQIFARKDIVCELIAARPELNLQDLWHLYCCSGTTFRELQHHADIVVYREARRYHHGRVAKALARRLRTYPLSSVPMHCWNRFCASEADKKRDPGRTVLLMEIGKSHPGLVQVWATRVGLVGWGYPAYARMTFDDALHDLSRSVDAILSGALTTGDESHVRSMGKILLCSEPLTFWRWMREEAMRIGFPSLAVAFSPHPLDANGYYEEDGRDGFDTLMDLGKGALSCKTTASIEYLFRTYLSGMLRATECEYFLVSDDVRLKPFVWYISTLKTHGKHINYERWYAQFMAVEASEKRCKRPRKILGWLLPLALAQFTSRRVKDPEALPIFLDGEAEREDYMEYHCYYTENEMFSFPGLVDVNHYAYHHPDNVQHAHAAVKGDPVAYVAADD